VGQGETPQEAIDKVKEAITSFEEAHQVENSIYSSSISISELHEFLNLEDAREATRNITGVVKQGTSLEWG
jgi:hypothetical protein